MLYIALRHLNYNLKSASSLISYNYIVIQFTQFFISLGYILIIADYKNLLNTSFFFTIYG